MTQQMASEMVSNSGFKNNFRTCCLTATPGPQAAGCILLALPYRSRSMVPGSQTMARGLLPPKRCWSNDKYGVYGHCVGRIGAAGDCAKLCPQACICVIRLRTVLRLVRASVDGEDARARRNAAAGHTAD